MKVPRDDAGLRFLVELSALTALAVLDPAFLLVTMPLAFWRGRSFAEKRRNTPKPRTVEEKPTSGETTA